MSYRSDFWDAVFECSNTFYVFDSGNILPMKPYVHPSQWN